MVAHQAIRMNDCAIALKSRLKVRQELLAICSALENIFLFITARSHMVESAWIFDA
jgi:hypothetical protein